jgi:hypothetical protein
MTALYTGLSKGNAPTEIRPRRVVIGTALNPLRSPGSRQRAAGSRVMGSARYFSTARPPFYYELHAGVIQGVNPFLGLRTSGSLLESR